MSAIGHYVHIHLAGAAAGIDLFGTSSRCLSDREIAEMVRGIREELLDERRRLNRIAEQLGAGGAPVMSTLARIGERVGRVRRMHGRLRRSDSDDLIDLETMRDAVAGKIAGWQALLTVVDRYSALDREELEFLLAQAEEQHRKLTEAHATVAARVLAED